MLLRVNVIIVNDALGCSDAHRIVSYKHPYIVVMVL